MSQFMSWQKQLQCRAIAMRGKCDARQLKCLANATPGRVDARTKWAARLARLVRLVSRKGNSNHEPRSLARRGGPGAGRSQRLLLEPKARGQAIDLGGAVVKKAQGRSKYPKTASEKVGKALHEMKTGELKSGGSGKTVTDRKQAIAIGLSEAGEAARKRP
jgi:hypothetical protein